MKNLIISAMIISTLTAGEHAPSLKSKKELMIKNIEKNFNNGNIHANNYLKCMKEVKDFNDYYYCKYIWRVGTEEHLSKNKYITKRENKEIRL